MGICVVQLRNQILTGYASWKTFLSKDVMKNAKLKFLCNYSRLSDFMRVFQRTPFVVHQVMLFDCLEDFQILSSTTLVCQTSEGKFKNCMQRY